MLYAVDLLFPELGPNKNLLLFYFTLYQYVSGSVLGRKQHKCAGTGWQDLVTGFKV